MSEKNTIGIDPTIYSYAESIASVELFDTMTDEAQITKRIQALAEAFQRAFEDWSTDNEQLSETTR